jgi:hypothetical protein
VIRPVLVKVPEHFREHLADGVLDVVSTYAVSPRHGGDQTLVAGHELAERLVIATENRPDEQVIPGLPILHSRSMRPV